MTLLHLFFVGDFPEEANRSSCVLKKVYDRVLLHHSKHVQNCPESIESIL